MPTFNIVAAYFDDGGVYEWQGEAVDFDDAMRAAQRQAFEDNCPTAVAEGEKPFAMLDAEQASVMDITADVEARKRGRRDPARHRRTPGPHAPSGRDRLGKRARRPMSRARRAP